MKVLKKLREEIWDKEIREKVYPSYNNLKTNDYFIGIIQISEFVEKYALNDKNINVYKTTNDSYIPYIHTEITLDIDKKYEIGGYKYEKEARIYIMNEML